VEQERRERSTRIFLRSVLLLGGIFIAFAALEFAVEYVRLGQPSLRQLSWAGVNNAKLVDELSPIARAYNNVLAMLVATVGLAIPLTANMHTPKLIELFLTDRINQVVLTLMALGAANVLWVLYIIGPEFAPMWAFRVAVYGALLGWIVVIPYFFYVVRFLDPSTIVTRLQRDTMRIVVRGTEGAIDPETAQDEIKERLFQIGTIILKSIDRADRGVAREGIWALKRIIDHYGERKQHMRSGWFRVGREDFVGMSHYALDWISEQRTWLEMQALRQLLLNYQHALAKAHDAISSISNANRAIARSAAARGDRTVVTLCMRFFNSFLREAINRKDTRAAYDVLYQYRELAGDLKADPEFVRRIAGFLRTYATVAEQLGHDFVSQVAAYDLCHVIETAYDADSPSAEGALDDLLALPNQRDGKVLPARVKTKLAAAGHLVEHELDQPLGRVRQALADVPLAAVEQAAAELATIDRQIYWEITDRAVNMEWTTEPRRKAIARFVASLAR
jgi:hypothetical protein